MKSLFAIFTGTLMLIGNPILSQKDSSGICFTDNDYIKHKLSFAINCKTQKHKIKSDMIFRYNKISIKHNDSIYTYPKDSVYGIKYCDGSIVRIFANSEFPLINPGEQIQIYKVVTTRNEGKAGTKVFTKYYFSKDEKSVIQPLTLLNVKNAFPNNHKFHDLIDMSFHSDSDLPIYDSFHKVMRVNRVLQNSIETKETNEKGHH